MTATLGEDWRNFFDFVSICAMKPHYFQHDQYKSPFREFDYETLRETVVKELEDGKTYSYGNNKLLEAHFEKKLGKKNLKCAFFGDQYIGDVYAP